MSERATALHGEPWHGVFYVTGGGSGLLTELLTTPGASRTVLEVSVPYAAASLTSLLGRAPDRACSPQTSRSLAMAAFQRALELSPESDPNDLFGLGATASLATDRARRGADRAHIAIQTASHTHHAEIAPTGDRAAQEHQLLTSLWSFMTATLDFETPVPHAPVHIASVEAEIAWVSLILGEQSAVATQPNDAGLLFPGAFNPVHTGHRRMLDVASRLSGREGAFELAIVNVDKPALDYHEIASRLTQLGAPVWLTRLPTFVEKARRFPGAHFAVGVDTIERIDAPRYYASVNDRDEAIDTLGALDCHFWVFGRADGGPFRELDDARLSPALRALATPVPQSEFREDVSSTELRRAAAHRDRGQ